MVLLAIALGDLKLLPNSSDQSVAVIKGATPSRVAKPPAPSRVAQDAPEQQHKPEEATATAAAAPAIERQAEREALQRQVAELQRQSAELQEQLAQRSSELEGRARDVAAARAESERLQQSIDALHGQQKAEEEVLTRLKAQEKQAVTTATMRRPVPRPVAPAMPSAPAPSTAQQLLTARQWLAAGRPAEARRVLAMVMTQMVLRPVTPDRPAAEGGNPSATDVGNAIRWLDIGASGQAMQAIDRAVNDVQAIAPDRP